jgi:hypothetical protein
VATADLKLGVSNLLGIVAPGSLLLAGLVVVGIGVEEYFGFRGYRTILSALANKDFLFTSVGLLVAYLLGSSIRLFANDAAEIFSGLYLRGIRRSRGGFSAQRFPYPVTTEWISEHIGPHVVEYLRSQNAAFAAEKNKHFYNYCKMMIRSQSPARADYLEAIESYVRFLAGAFVSSALTGLLCLPLAVAFYVHRRFELSLAYGLVSATMFIVIISVLERFRHQHAREVIHTWLSYYECSSSDCTSRSQLNGKYDAD